MRNILPDIPELYDPDIDSGIRPWGGTVRYTISNMEA